MKNIAIFASGSGTNTENLIQFFRTSPYGNVKLVLTNRAGAGVINRAEKAGIEALVFTREQFFATDEVLSWLLERKIDFIVLAGFLWLVPDAFVKAFENKVVNIHPALLPAYGGKGMYGDHVHRAVIANSEKESGISIHWVNSRYDEGNIIFQARCPVYADDVPENLAARIHELEYEHFPKVLEGILKEI